MGFKNQFLTTNVKMSFFYYVISSFTSNLGEQKKTKVHELQTKKYVWTNFNDNIFSIRNQYTFTSFCFVLVPRAFILLPSGSSIESLTPKTLVCLTLQNTNRYLIFPFSYQSSQHFSNQPSLPLYHYHHIPTT